jgi:Spy/CpxP family protein refolding chaperone
MKWAMALALVGCASPFGTQPSTNDASAWQASWVRDEARQQAYVVEWDRQHFCDPDKWGNYGIGADPKAHAECAQTK